jgi:putative ABC transport system ATP-binding protein
LLVLAMVIRPDTSEEFAFFSGQGQRLDVIEAWGHKDLDLLAYERMHYMGYVLQTGGLVPFFSVRESIGLSRRGLGLPVQDAVEVLAKRLGVGQHLEKLPGQLSVGERQRMAIARAMAHEPWVIIADRIA